MAIDDQGHVGIGRRLVGLPGVRIEFDGSAHWAVPGLSRGDTNFVSVGVDSPEAEVFTHYLCGSLSAEDESDLSYYNACSWGEETLTLEEQRDLVLDRFGPMRTLDLQIESVFQVPDQLAPRPLLTRLTYRVTLRHKGREVLTTSFTTGVGCVPGFWPGPPSDPQMLEMVLRTGEGGWYYDEQGARQYAPGPPILPNPEQVLCSLILDADGLEFDSFEAWADAYGVDPKGSQAQADFRLCRRNGRALKRALGDEWMRSLTLWARQL
jgi:hypothetical protein